MDFMDNMNACIECIANRPMKMSNEGMGTTEIKFSLRWRGGLTPAR
jgi:hypothetical protein